MPDSPPLEKIIRDAVKEGIARVHTQVPGRVLEYDHDTQRAKIQLIVQHAFDNDGEVDYYKPKPLVNVPVKFDILTWPLEPGDTGHVEFWERSGDEYLSTGNDNTRPRDLRRFDLSDAVFSPCFLLGDADVDDEVVLHRRGGKIKIGGSDVSEFLARADRVESRLQAIENYINSHEHTYTAPAIPASPAPTAGRVPEPAITPTTQPGDTASDHVQGD